MLSSIFFEDLLIWFDHALSSKCLYFYLFFFKGPIGRPAPAEIVTLLNMYIYCIMFNKGN